MQRLFACAIGALVLASAAAGHAQRPRTRDAEARDRFYAGAQLYQEGDYEAALAEFQESHRLSPVPVAMFNVAQTLRVLRRYPQALAAFRRYLREGTDAIPPDRRAEVQRTIRALERRIAWITLEVEPHGAQISLDDQPLGTSPLPAALVLGAGRHVLEITAEGHLPLRDVLEVVGRQARTVRVGLAPRETAGAVRVTSQPERAHVRIDGLEVGQAPVSRSVPHGGHVIEAHLPGYRTYRAPVELAERQVLDLRVVLEEDRERGVLEAWWFWTGVAAIVIGAVVAVAVVLSQPSEPLPIPGNSYDQVIGVLLAR